MNSLTESARLNEVRRLKQQGLSMAEIIARLDGSAAASAHKAAPQGTPLPNAGSLTLTLDDIQHPAYMISQSFELMWINEAAKQYLFPDLVELPHTSEQRNIFRLLPVTQSDWANLTEFHVAIAKSRLGPDHFGNLCRGLDAVAYARLQAVYLEAAAAPQQPVIQMTLLMPERGGHPSQRYYTAYATFFREGIFIVLVPETSPADEMLALLCRRDEVIRSLLRKRLPVLTDLAVLVADLQGSTKICSELPPEEYFELINEIWRTLAPTFRKYKGTYGKHVGDGLVYYFLPQPDSHYLANALDCAIEIRAEIQRISKAWQIRKQWFNELYLNTGINEGQEWLGTYQAPTSVEFVVLGDTINQAARLSEFARHGSIWTTKSLISKLPVGERARISFGVRRRGPEGREVFIPSSYSQVGTLLEQTAERYDKLRDIATLAITEIVDIRPRQYRPRTGA